MVEQRLKTKLINGHSGPDLIHTNDKIVDFFYEHLDEYGDTKEDILRAIDYAIERGGFTLIGLDDDGEEIVSTVVVNETHMGGYIPENILVYIATHKEHRGKGLGKQMMEYAIKLCVGDIALHVEPENPALHLYKKMGFENKYLEMRLKRK